MSASGSLDPIEETIALHAIEPFHLHRLELAGRVRQGLTVGAIGGRNGRSGRCRQGLAEVDRDDSARLEAAILLFDDAFDQRALGQAAPTMVAKHRKMDQDIAVARIADQKTKAAGGVEPFDPAGNLEAVTVVMDNLFLRTVGHVGLRFVIAANDCMRNNVAGVGRRISDRRPTLYRLTHAISYHAVANG